MPTLHLVSKSVFRLEQCCAKGTLIIPAWKSAVFWPVLFPYGGHRQSVTQVIEFSDASNVFAPSPPGVFMFSFHERCLEAPCYR